VTRAREMEEVEGRGAVLHPPGYYSMLNPGHLYLMQRREEALLRALRRLAVQPLAERRILDLGCGGGEEMIRHVLYGADPRKVAGVDLQFPRLAGLKRRFAGLNAVQADAARLPFADASFDLVSQATMMTLVLDPEVRTRIAAEMVRVCKPSGAILWFDYRYSNPANRDARGIGAAEIRRLFPGCEVSLRAVSLAPPLARRLVRLGVTVCRVVEWCPPLRTHYLAVIRRTAA
jgi:SAM-dependent methyltransferase